MRYAMKHVFFCLFLLSPVAAYSEETRSAEAPSQESDTQPRPEEPTLYEHYVVLQRMQEELARRPIDEQSRLQSEVQREQQRACDRLRKDHRERVSKEEYRLQGGDQFLVFTWELEQWCGTLQR